MPTPRLFVREALGNDTEMTLGADAARYIGRVLRCRPADSLLLFDGSGQEFPATIETISKQAVTVRLGEAKVPDVESPLDVHLLQGISRGDRMDTVVQKATELGVRRILPLLTEHSVVRLDGQRSEKRQEHWQRIAESACEQSGRTVPPVIEAPATLTELLACAADNTSTRLLLQPGATANLRDVSVTPDRIELLIGPEGGFSDAEQQHAMNSGFQPVGMGPRVLRTETAAIAALALVQSLWGDLRAS